MALQFTPPPDWLIQDYYNRKDPSQVASEGIQNVLGTYMTLKNQQDVNALKQAENARQEAELRLKQEADRRAQGEYARNWDPSSLPGAGGAYNTYSPSNYGKASGPTLTQDSQMRSLLTQEGSSPSLRPSGTENVALNANDEESPVIARWNEMNANKGIGLGQNSSLAKAPANAQEEANLAFANALPLGIKGEDALTRQERAKKSMDQKRTFQEKQEVAVDGIPVGYMTFDTRSGEKQFISYNEDEHPSGQIPAGAVFIPKVAPTIEGGDVEFFAKGKTLNQIFSKVDSLYKDKYVGPLAGRGGKALDKYTPFGDAERSEFRNYVAKAFNNLIYLRSGKQINQEEANRMAEEFMSINNTPIAFQSALGSMKQEMKWLVENRKSGLSQAGYRGASGIDTGTSEVGGGSPKRGGGSETPEQRKARLIAELSGAN